MTSRNPTALWILALMTTIGGAAPLAGGQAGSTTVAEPSAAKPAKPFTITGCVTADGATADSYTLREKKGGVAYRLMGVKTFAYEGRRVRIVGGLYPSPNIAAQAGAIDPTQAAMAAATPGGLGTVGQPLEFRVSEIRPVRGACPPLR